ncbi:MAG: YceI family protein [Pseudomonadota bacterium]
MKATAQLVLFMLLAWQLPVQAATETYAIADDHSFANWQIRHVAAKVSGTFTGITGTVALDRTNPAATRAEARIAMLSMTSGHRERDLHTLSAEYLDALKFKEMTFVSTGAKATGPNAGVLQGKFTLHGVTRDIELPFKLLGFGPDPWGGSRMGVEAHTRIRLSDYGYGFGSLAPEKSPLGDEVEITLLIEGIRLGPDGKPLMAKPAK